MITQIELKDKELSEANREKAYSQIESKKEGTKYDKKIQMYQHEIKKLETEMFRIKKQMTKILNEKTSFANSFMEIKRSGDMKYIAKI